MPIVNQTISEVLAIKGTILPVASSTASLVSNFAPLGHTDRLQAILNVGSLVGTADIAIEQAYPNLNATGIVITADAAASATAIVVSGGTYAVNDWVSADGVNFVRVTTARTGAGSLVVTALPAAVTSGAAVTALGAATTVASLSAGAASGYYPFNPGQVPAVASAIGVYTLDVRASDVNNNNPAASTDGTANGYNPVTYGRIKITLAVGSTTAVVGGTFFDAVNGLPAYLQNAPGVVINQIQG